MFVQYSTAEKKKNLLVQILQLKTLRVKERDRKLDEKMAARVKALISKDGQVVIQKIAKNNVYFERGNVSEFEISGRLPR